jgi:hypothetical protein
MFEIRAVLGSFSGGGGPDGDGISRRYPAIPCSARKPGFLDNEQGIPGAKQGGTGNLPASPGSGA